MFFNRFGRGAGSTVRSATKRKNKGTIVKNVATLFTHPETLYENGFNRAVHKNRFVLSRVYAHALFNSYGLSETAGSGFTLEIIRTQATWCGEFSEYNTGTNHVLGPLAVSMMEVLNGATEPMLKLAAEHQMI